MLCFQFSGIYLRIDFCTYSGFKFRIIHQLFNNFCYRIIYFFFVPLLPVITFMTIHIIPMLAGIIKIILIKCSVFFLLTVYISIHSLSTNWTFKNSGQNMFMLQTMDFLMLYSIYISFLFCQVPIIFGNNGFVNTIT